MKVETKLTYAEISSLKPAERYALMADGVKLFGTAVLQRRKCHVFDAI